MSLACSGASLHLALHGRVLLQAEGCLEAGAVPAGQPPRLFLAPLSSAGADAEAEWQGQPGNPLPGRRQRVMPILVTSHMTAGPIAMQCCLVLTPFWYLCMPCGLTFAAQPATCVTSSIAADHTWMRCIDLGTFAYFRTARCHEVLSCCYKTWVLFNTPAVFLFM